MSFLIELNNIVKTYESGGLTQTVLKGMSLSVMTGELLAIMGASGSGKSTLMNIMGLLDRPTSGDYFLNARNVLTIPNQDIAAIRNQMIGFVFQSFFLLPRLSAMQNVMLPLTYRDLSEGEMQKRAHQVLQQVGIDHLAHRKPRELSGGQQQRVAIARALVGNPSIILADEPTGALDSKIGQEIMDLFKHLNEMGKNTIIVITHDGDIASQCHRTIHVQDGMIV